MHEDQKNDESAATLATRRSFVKTTAAVAGGLVIAFHLPSEYGKAFGAEKAAASKAPAKIYPPNAFIKIAPDDSITLVINKLEMGQGVNTSMAQLIAEELECDFSRITSVSAPVDAVYNHTAMPTQMTGGSSALISSYEQHRKIGAMMRTMLVTAAAQRWQVPVASCHAEKGAVVHATKGRLTYGELAEDAAKLPLPTAVKLKDPKDFRVIGQSVPRVDAAGKSTGQAQFGIDVRLPGMVYAVIARPPLPGAKLTSVDDTAARAVAGVADVVRFGDSVAVTGRNTYAARQGRDALKLTWDMQGLDKTSTASLVEDYRAQASKPGTLVTKPARVAAKAAKTVEAEYVFPYLAHAPMEPMNCTIQFDGETAEIWAGHQMPTFDRMAAAKVLGLAPEAVTINTVYAGGSFGRRANKNCDYVVEAASLAKELRKPVKIVWTREDDMQGGYYRPMNVHKAVLGFDAKGHLTSWSHHVVGQSIVGGSPLEAMIVKNGIDPLVTEGIADTPYALPGFQCAVTIPKGPVTTLWWRSVGHTHTAFAMETLIDEAALAAKTPPLAFRHALLAKSKRHLAVLDLLAKTSPIASKPPEGHAYGMAIHESFNTVVGHVVDVSMESGMPKVHRVWSAVDCGQVVNPEGAKSQVEGAIVYGLSAALYGEIVVEGGKVTTSNFDDYQVARLPEAPVVEVHFVPSTGTPTGLGEPGLPPLAPAVANAVFTLTGKRVRQLPMRKALA